MHVAADEYQGELIFLHKVKDGAVDDSYGIQVAKLDLPNEVIEEHKLFLTNSNKIDAIVTDTVARQ